MHTLGNTPGVAYEYHSGTIINTYDVMTGYPVLQQSDLVRFLVPEDYSLEIIEGHFSLISACTYPI